MKFPDPHLLVQEAGLPDDSLLGSVLVSELHRLHHSPRLGLRHALAADETGPFESALRRDKAQRGGAVIAEYKRASPSLGPFAAGVPLETQLESYEIGGAACFSVLAETAHFQGGAAQVRRAVRFNVPVLYKGFVIAESQLAEAAQSGAHAVLLIARVLRDHTAFFAREARARGLEPLVELHDDDEAPFAQEARARLVGLNARDLATFEMKTAPLAHLRPLFPDAVLIRESGLATPADARAAFAAGFDAVLIGEALMRSASPQFFLREIFAEEVR